MAVDLSSRDRPWVMGIINTTPDSFSDGGQLYSGQQGGLDLDRVLSRVECMVADGVDMLDVGGESTRPGAKSVGLQEELDRVIPVVEAVSSRFECPISVDTSSPRVMAAAASAGAAMLNDVRALTRDGALQAAAATGLPVCLMHMKGDPQSMQQQPEYRDVVTDVVGYLEERVAACEAVGIAKERLIVDPGFGFGKTLEHNLALFRALPELSAMRVPVLVGVSRKSMIGAILAENGHPRGVDGRLVGSVALAVMAAQRGAAIIRVHDVKETVDALAMLYAVDGE